MKKKKKKHQKYNFFFVVFFMFANRLVHIRLGRCLLELAAEELSGR